MSKRIVVLDDDASVLAAVERVLKANGYVSQVYDSVERFLSEAPLNGASCLVLDVNLSGTCGIELRRQLTQSGVSLPVIFMTGDDKEATREAALEAGCVVEKASETPDQSVLRVELFDRCGAISI
jgi:FixJ family two-component response regulator